MLISFLVSIEVFLVDGTSHQDVNCPDFYAVQINNDPAFTLYRRVNISSHPSQLIASETTDKNTPEDAPS